MIQDINKIYVNSSVRINANTMPILCFADGRAIDNTLYSLSNNELNIYVESTEYLTLSYGYNDAKVYHFSVVLDDFGVIIEKYDNRGVWLQNLKINQLLVFVDGRLLDKDEFEFLSSEAIALKVQFKDSKFHSVIIYSCNYKFEEGIFAANSGETIECNYSRDRYLIFKNGYLIPNDHIFVSTGNESIRINYPYSSTDEIRYVVLPTNNQTINFKTSKGFLTYGPTDDNNKDVPLRYDYELVFEQNVINLVDDIRTGFILHSDEYDSEYLIVDTNFNKKNIKALSLNNDFTKTYTCKEYYLLVPENRKITEYLSDFDKKGTVIPEVLEIFQRFLLDEFHDEVQRLRNIRNISKVDSIHINKLLKLLGNKIDLKNKTLLQKRELLEELSSFYNKSGTKQSYNIFNISDTDIGLADIEQLFTIRNNASPKSDNIVSTVDIGSITRPGQYYEIGQEYLLAKKTSGESTGVKVKVNNTNTSGGILSASVSLPETVGNVNIATGDYKLISTGNSALFNINSQPTYFNYTLSQFTGVTTSTLPEGHSISCQTAKYPGLITFTNNHGTIEHKMSITKGSNEIITIDPATGEPGLEKASKNVDNMGATLHSDVIKPVEYIFSSGVASNVPQKIRLESGIYYYEMSGGGGAGGAGDSTIGDYADITSFDGSNGEFVTGLFYLPQSEIVDLYIGSGAAGSYARGHEPYRCGSVGAGFGGEGAPQEGTAQRKGWSTVKEVHYWHHLHRKTRWDTVTEYDTIASGSGGGASAIVVNGSVKGLAKGGKGGNVIANHVNPKYEYQGGNGGGGYFYSTTNQGAKGGRHSVSDGSFSSLGGSDGWIKIKKCTIKYTITLDSLNHENAVVGSKYKTNFFGQNLPSTAHVQFTSPEDSGVDNITLNKETFEEKLSPTTGEYAFIYNGVYWKYNGSTVKLSEYGIGYDGAPATGDTITIKYTSKYDDFELVVTGYDGRRKIITSYNYNPKNGENYFTYKNNKLLLNDFTNGTDVPIVFYPDDSNIKVQITSTATKYAYSLQLEEITSKSMGYDANDKLTFVNTSDPDLAQFEITVDSVTSAGTITQFHYTPTSGTNEIIRTDEEATRDKAENAELYIVVSSQTLADVNTLKEYVDFFNKEELGAEHKIEYRFPITDYGSVIEGTPNSPYPWTLGKPDEDYGLTDTICKNPIKKEVRLSEDTTIVCDMDDGSTLIKQDRDYGYIRDAIKGKWYQWWDWERDPNYYPTNHVEVTLSPKNTGDIDKALERFFSQFYKIASTVLYIHRITLNYSFGNTTAYAQNADGTVDGAILFGFMSGQPISYEKHYLTNDPDRQVRI